MQGPSPPLYSPDGRFIWDGQRWVPIASAGTTSGARRSVVLAFFASFILVGLGTMFAGKAWKGAVLFVLGNGTLISGGLLALSLAHACSLSAIAGQPPTCSNGYPGQTVALTTVILGSTGVLLYLFGLFDAVASAREWNRDHGWPR